MNLTFLGLFESNGNYIFCTLRICLVVEFNWGGFAAKRGYMCNFYQKERDHNMCVCASRQAVNNAKCLF